jgi:UDP-N-acetylglucosamine--N-acetylmuramyl-(pentapeptide) pyrophosphoryl-undecaprenol N-acetylglucosamine transferase
MVKGGGAVLVADADFDPSYVSADLIPLISDSRNLKRMGQLALETSIKDGTARLYRLVKSVLKR